MTLNEQLTEPFAADVVGWKPQTVKGNRALAVAYIDARDVMDRLDAVVGTENWEDTYTPMPDGSVVCHLTVTFGGASVTKCDVGSESEQPDHGDRLKAAFSDALKRAAVKFGIGRYLYRLPMQWCDFDPVKKAFTQTPKLPTWALPKGAAQPAPKPAPLPPPPKLSPENEDNQPNAYEVLRDRYARVKSRDDANNIAIDVAKGKADGKLSDAELKELRILHGAVINQFPLPARA